MARVERPPALHGTATEQLDLLYRYLYRLAETLEAETPESAAAAPGGEVLTALRAQSREQTNALSVAKLGIERQLSPLGASLNALTAAVGDAESGLVKTVSEQGAALAALTAALSAEGQNAAVAGTLSVGGVSVSGQQLGELLELLN